MSHQHQLEFVSRVGEIFPGHFRGRKVLEIGSLEVNDSVRRFFRDCDYLGIDIAAGPGVDVVCQGQDFAAPDGAFDVVISCEVMEHNPHWRETFANMVRLCAPHGLVVMSCAGIGRREHGTARSDPQASPLTVAQGWNYYRNLSAADFRAAGLVEAFRYHRFMVNWVSCDLYFVGVKDGVDAATAARVERLARDIRRRNFTTLKGLRRFLRHRARATA